jgi:hypothetical protein
VNARDNTPLRAKIADRLAAGEDTAAGIANAIGKGDTPSVVVKELNAMRTDGQVECEQRGKKKELVYWLAVPLDVAAGSAEPKLATDLIPAAISEVMLPPGVRHGTRAAQIYRVLPLYGAKPMTARQIATATGAALGLISPTLSGMVKAGQVSRVSSGVTEAYGYTRLPPAGSDSEGGETDVKAQSAEFPPQIQPQITPAQAASDEVERDDAMPPADASLLALANRELADRLARVAHVLRGSGLEGLKDLDDGADLQSAAAALTGAYQMALAEPAMLRRELAKADADLQQIHTLLAPRVAGPIDPSDLGEVECAEKAAAMIDEATGDISRAITAEREKDDALLEQARSVVELRSLLDEERTARQALQEQIAELQREAMRGASLLSGDDRYTAAGYLVRASKRKPRTLLDKDKARDAALSSIRAGAQRAEVFALVPIGHARRGAEWMPS